MIRFLQLRTERFGSLPDQVWPFGEGFQVVQGANEAGKTSLQQALTWALYGDAASKDQSYASRRRWGETEHFLLELVLDVGGGEHRLLRDFQARHNRLFLPDGKRISSKEQIREWLAKTLKLPTEASFRATACVRQDELARDGDLLAEDIKKGTIQSLLEQHVLSGSGANIDLLLRQLKDRVDRLRRGLDHPVKKQNEGPIKARQEGIERAQEELQKLRAQLGESERAAVDLEHARTTLERDERAREDALAHLTRDSLLREASRRVKEATERFRQIQERQTRREDLLREIPAHERAAIALRANLKDLEAQLGRGREAQQILQRLEELHREVDELTHDLAGLDRCHADLQECRAEMAHLPLLPHEIHNARALPGEIDALQEELNRLAQRRQDLDQELARGEQEITTASTAVHVAQTRRRALDEAVKRAQQVAQVEAERQALRQTLQQQQARRAQVETLQWEIERLDEALADTAALDAIDGSRLTQLPTQIEQLEQLLLAEGFEVTLEPLQALDLHAEFDGTSTDHAALSAPLRLRAQQELTLHLHQIARLRVANHSRASLQLNQLRQELAHLLTQSQSVTVAEYGERRRQRDRQLQQRQNLQQQLAALLRETSRIQIQHSLAAIESQLAALGEGGAVRDPPVPSVQELVQELDQAMALEAAARDRLSRAVATVEVLRAQHHAPSAGDNLQAEVQRKRDVLQQLLRKAGAPSVEGLTTLQQRWAKLTGEEQRLRSVEASILSGRREVDMRSRVARLRLAEEELRKRLVGLGEPQPTGAEMDYLEAEYRRVYDACEGVESRYKTAQAELQALPGEALERDHSRYLVDLATAEHEKRAHEPFELGAEDRIRLERQVKELEAAIRERRVQIGRLQEQARREDHLVSRMAELEETVEELARQCQDLHQRARVDEQVRALLEAARKQAIADIYEKLPTIVGGRLEVMTRGIHKRVVGDGLDLAPWSPRKGGPLHERELSRGTRDQFYLALRLTLLDLLFGDARPPLLLDDPLVHCDPLRRREILSLLADYARGGQVLLFTCHTFPEYEVYPTLQLS